MKIIRKNKELLDMKLKMILKNDHLDYYDCSLGLRTNITLIKISPRVIEMTVLEFLSYLNMFGVYSNTEFREQKTQRNTMLTIELMCFNPDNTAEYNYNYAAFLTESKSYYHFITRVLDFVNNNNLKHILTY